MKTGVLIAIIMALWGQATAVRGSKEHGLSRSFYDYPQSAVVMFDLELRTLSFAPADITSLMRQSPMITADALHELFADGKGDVHYPPMLCSVNSGQEVALKSVVERTYPSSFENRGYSTREVGLILRAVPRAYSDLQGFSVDVHPELIRELPASADVNGAERDAESLSLATPTFQTLSLMSTFHMRDGETAVIGSQFDEGNDRLLFMLLTVRMRTSNVTPISTWIRISREVGQLSGDPFGAAARAVSLADAVLENLKAGDRASAQRKLESYRDGSVRVLESIKARLREAEAEISGHGQAEGAETAADSGE